MNPKLFLSIAIISLTSSQCLAMSESLNEMLFRSYRRSMDESSNINLIKQALNEGANINAQDGDGLTALHFAVIHDDLDAVNLLLNAGADINIKNNFDETPLELARDLKRGYHGQTPLEIARAMRGETIIKLLEDWNKKTRKKIQEETSPYFISDLGDIVADYVVGPKKDVDKKEKSE